MRPLNERERAALDAARKLIGDILAGIRGAFIVALPFLLRLGCVAVALGGAAWAWPSIHSAFGGDVAALLPAAAIVLLPGAAVLASGLSWGGLLLAGVTCAGLGVVLPRLDVVARGLLVVAPIGLAVFHTLSTEVRNEQDE